MGCLALLHLLKDTPLKPAIDLLEIEAQTGNGCPEPFASTLGPYEGRDLTGHFDLTRFGASVETLPPGSQSALRHWHTTTDELVVMLQGELTLITDAGCTLMQPHMCVGFKAGESNGHHLVNESDQPALFLVVGSRSAEDAVHYPDDDIQWAQDNQGKWVAQHKDGQPY